MCKPNFKYTNRIVRLLTQISASRVTILSSPLIPKWEVALRREAIIHSAHSSTSIEGNRLSLEQVSDLALGREIMATRKDKQEVLTPSGFFALMIIMILIDRLIIRHYKVLIKRLWT